MVCSVNGVDLYYEVSGRGTPTFLVHGNGESHEIFDHLIPELAKTHRVYAVDSRCHGRSTRTPEIHYQDMAEDLMAFIRKLNLEKPIFYGFSDGGILGLLIAIQAPTLLGKLIVSGANLNPRGLTLRCRKEIRRDAAGGDLLNRMMLLEPHITASQLQTITVPTVVLAGSYDVVRRSHTRRIAAAIPGSILQILPREGHDTYIVHSDKLYSILAPYL